MAIHLSSIYSKIISKILFLYPEKLNVWILNMEDLFANINKYPRDFYGFFIAIKFQKKVEQLKKYESLCESSRVCDPYNTLMHDKTIAYNYLCTDFYVFTRNEYRTVRSNLVPFKLW